MHKGGIMAKPLMIQGTMSSAGKSLITAGLCRIFHQDGYRAAPFKSQNMALNSFITREGLEMGRAQVMQAEAAGVEPSVLMNPILLKPNSDMGSQVIVNGEVLGNMRAVDYFAYKPKLRPAIMEAYSKLSSRHDIIVIEGAGSPAEINLKADDIVNMGMAEMADAPVLLVGDIDRGGVFASLYGTVELLTKSERARIKGFIINKFRGDVKLLESGLAMIEDLTHIPVLGVVPYLRLDIADEDSVTERFRKRDAGKPLDIAVIRLPRISNFTDFDALARLEPVGLRYADSADQLKTPDLVILPGTKNTMADLMWLRENGLEAAIQKLAASGALILGICGGYQMLGETLSDPEGVEYGGRMRGMALMPADTTFMAQKTRTRVSGTARPPQGPLSALANAAFEGYEIHMGQTILRDGVPPFAVLSDGKPDGAAHENIIGSYVHGLLDGALGTAIVRLLLRRKGLAEDAVSETDAQAYKQEQYNALADALRVSLDLAQIYRIMGLKRP